MEKLCADSINRLIEDCLTDNEEDGLTIPKDFTYPKDVFISFDKLVDNKERVEDLLRQALPFFSGNYEMAFPYNFFQQLGEKDEEGKYKYWTNNKDDLSRYLFIGMYSGAIEAPKNTIIMTKNGEREVLTHKILRHLKPVVVKE
jgi:hypothetical protein